MRAAQPSPALRGRRELALLAPLAVLSLLLNFTGLEWGLPNGDVVWAADAFTPMAPLAIAHHLLSGGWNSGWFFYKYPLAHPLLLTVIYAPYLLWLKVSGGFGHPMSDYPYGLTDPEHALFVLGVLGRGVSALMTTAATLVWYAACREVFNRRTAWLASWFFATLFPVVYYAHTTNVDAPVLWWSVLAVYGAARGYSRVRDRLGMVIVGGAAAMAISTKESAIGWIVTLPVMLLVAQWRRRRIEQQGELLPPGMLAGCAVAVVVFAVMSGGLINPLGLWHRAHFLSRAMPEAVQLQYAPRLCQVGTVAPKAIDAELAQLGETLRVVAASLGWPLACAAALGCAMYGWRRPGAFFVIMATGYYVTSVRTFEMLRARYVLPLSIIACLLAACALDWGAGRMRGAGGRRLMAVLTVLFLVYSAARGGDAVRLFREDSRYAAEQWLLANATPTTSIEVYQRPAYLPRFGPAVRLVKVPFDQISIPGFVSRRPDLVVLSSAGIAGVTAKYENRPEVEDGEDQTDRVVSWRRATGEPIAFEYTRNRTFVDALEGGCLGYVLAARFATTPWLAEPTIPSLAPEIRIYQRRPSETAEPSATAAADRCRHLTRAEFPGAVEARSGS